MLKSKSINKESKENTEWRNVIQLLPCKKQKSYNIPSNSNKKMESPKSPLNKVSEITDEQKGVNNTNTNNNTDKIRINISINNNTKQKELMIISKQENQKTSSHSKNSSLPHPVMILDPVGKEDILPITASLRQECQCTCVII